MPDETQQPTTADAESSGVSKPASVQDFGEAKPESTSIPSENPTPNQSSQSSDDTGQVSELSPIPEPLESAEVPPVVPETPPKPESTPTTPETKPEITTDPNITIEKRGNDVTITEVMQPEPKPEVSKVPFDMKSLFSKLKEKLSSRTEKRLSKIVELARKKGEIRNDDVEKLLHVSDRTASRYLTKLAKQGRLKNIGNPKWPRYLAN